MNPIAGRFKAGAQERDRRALAIGSGNMDDRRQTILRIAEPRHQTAHPIKGKIDRSGVKPAQAFEDRVDPAHRRYLLLGDGGCGLLQQPEHATQGFMKIVTADNHVDHAVLVEIFSPLKPFGKLLANGFLDDAGTGKADLGSLSFALQTALTMATNPF